MNQEEDEEDEDRKIGRKGNGHSFFGYNSYRFPSKQMVNDDYLYYMALLNHSTTF